MHLSLSVEDTNKLRKQLGLKLIPTEDAHDDVPVHDEQAQLAARLARATERLDSRKTNSDPVEDKKPLSTNAWLDRMRAMKTQQSLARAPSPAPHPIEEPAEKLAAEKPAAEKPAEGPVQKPPESEKPPIEKITPRMYKDPLQAPSEAVRDEALRMRTPRAIFKPKKLKGSSKPRKRVAAVQLPQLSAEQEEETLAHILTQSRRKLQTEEEVLDQSPHIYKQDDTTTNSAVVIDTVSTIRNTLQTRKEEAVAEPSSKVEEEEQVEQHEEINDEDEPHSTHLSGVADLLKQLHEHTPKRVPTSKSRDWARKLAQSRQDRINELERAEQLYKSLAPKDREEAIKLHQQQLAQDQIREAREVAAHYKPAINLEHHDEFGNPLDTRQAFKKLSKAFHDNQKKNQPK